MRPAALLMRLAVAVAEVAAAVVVLTVVPAACGTVELDRPKGWDSAHTGNAGNSANGGTGALEPEAKQLYVTGVEYPKDYDWHIDDGYASVNCDLFLMRGDERILTLTVNQKYLTGPDADMHRCFNGHLYTDWSTDTETVIRKDGNDLFRYSGREYICGFYVQGDDVYTLGQPRDGSEGWTWRRNGEIVMSRTSGYIMNSLSADDGSLPADEGALPANKGTLSAAKGALSLRGSLPVNKGTLSVDNGMLWFSYVDPVVGADGSTKNRYYLMSGGFVTPVGMLTDVLQVDDILLYDGIIHYTAVLQGMFDEVAYVGDRAYFISGGSTTRSADCKLYYDGGSMFIVGMRRDATSKGVDHVAIWRDYAQIWSQASELVDIHACYIDGDDFYSVITDATDGKLKVLLRNSVVMSFDAGEYSFLTHGTGFAGEGHFALALKPAVHGVPPALLTDGEVKTYDFNGYFTSVSYW